MVVGIFAKSAYVRNLIGVYLLAGTNAWNRQFSLYRIVRPISCMPQPFAQVICGELIQAISEHQGDARQDDDMQL